MQKSNPIFAVDKFIKRMAKQQKLICSFCGRNREEVKILIAGQDGHICENCVEHAREIVEQEVNQKAEVEIKNDGKPVSNKKPMEIKTFTCCRT